jgi:hypothetical protein
MLTDLVQIRRLGEKQRDENLRLRLHLKRRNFQERRLKRISQDIEEQIDCTACANCCRVATVKINDRDVEKLGGSTRRARTESKPRRMRVSGREPVQRIRCPAPYLRYLSSSDAGLGIAAEPALGDARQGLLLPHRI